MKIDYNSYVTSALNFMAMEIFVCNNHPYRLPMQKLLWKTLKYPIAQYITGYISLPKMTL